MTDTVEKAAEAMCARNGEDLATLSRQGIMFHYYLERAKAMLSTLTPGARWTLPDGREMVAVPVEASEAMKAASYRIPHARDEEIYAAMIAAASEPDASAQASDE